MTRRIKHWRVETTSVYRPNVLVASVLCAIFVAIGVGIWLVLKGSVLHDAPAAVNAILRNALPGVWVGLGLVALAAIARDAIRRRRPLLAASPDVLPEVPIEPVNDTQGIAHAHVRHEIKGTDAGWSLVPRYRAINRTSLLAAAWILLTVAGVNVLLWSFGPGNFQRARIAMTAGSVMAGVGMMAFVWYATWDSRHRARRMDVNLKQRTIQIDDDQPLPLDNLVAIQICPLRIKIPPTPAFGKRWPGTDGDALEVNAVLHGSGGEIDRKTLYVVLADLAGAAKLAADLAERFDVPLLNHATRDHWAAEFERKGTAVDVPRDRSVIAGRLAGPYCWRLAEATKQFFGALGDVTECSCQRAILSVGRAMARRCSGDALMKLSCDKTLGTRWRRKSRRDRPTQPVGVSSRQ